MNNNILLDFGSRTPIYEQIINEIERYVALGLLKPNEQIPSIRELASNLGINPNTVKKAYTDLEKNGTIYVVSTKGTFISDKTKNLVERKINKLVDDIKNIMIELETLGVSKEEIIKKIK